MLRRSFIFLPGVGISTERSIWEDGVLDWDEFVDRETAGALKGDRKRRSDPLVKTASEKLSEGDLDFFSGLFRPGDNWRLWDEFGERALFL
ncbi:MAG: exonuclease, partial [Thermoplasmatota archaeon]